MMSGLVDDPTTRPWPVFESRAAVPDQFRRAAHCISALMVLGVAWIATLTVLALRTDWTAAAQQGNEFRQVFPGFWPDEDAEATATALHDMAVWVVPFSALGVAALFALGMVALARSIRKGDRWARLTAVVALPLFLWLELVSLVKSGTWIETIEALLAVGLTAAAGWYLLLSPVTRSYVSRYRG